MPGPRTTRWIAVWIVLSAAVCGWLAWVLLDPQPSSLRTLFTPGAMTHGHHSIELACGACHTSAFGGREALQQACVGCHGDQLRVADDAHPRSKFTDPRNADLMLKLDAKFCVTCHVEHRPKITHAMGLTLPADYCVTCHAGIAEERATHAGLGFDTCASAGCHNYHDNRALHQDFLIANAHAPALKAERTLPARDFGLRWRRQHERPPATLPDHDATPALGRDWLASTHAAAGVNCGDCHAASGRWQERLDHTACSACHEAQVEGFLASKHGMPVAVGLPPMTPASSRLPMRDDAAHRELGCTSCHAAHRFDTQTAAIDACLGCHADAHSLAYEGSPHHALWLRERAGTLPPGSGVSCASCHLPRQVDDAGGIASVTVHHNQNDTLRPSEAMLRPVCLHCHGLGAALDALADRGVIDGNFRHPPARHVESIDMALRRVEADRARRAAGGNPTPTPTPLH